MGDVTILTETGERVGTTFRETVEEGGRGTTATGEVAEYVPGPSIAFRLRSDSTVADVRCHVRARDGGARLDVDAAVRFRSFLRLVGPLVGPLSERRIRRSWRRSWAGCGACAIEAARKRKGERRAPASASIPGRWYAAPALK